MRCENCGTELAADEFECRRCQSDQAAVQVLSPEEKQSFDGITIDTAGDAPRYEKYEQQDSAEPRIFVRQIHINPSGLGLLPKLIIGIVLFGLVMFIALPVALIFFAIGIVAWFLSRR